MKHLMLFYACFAVIIGLESCEFIFGPDPKPKTELEKLPAATQEGKNTLGCLVNGKAWVPKGDNGLPNLDLSYDPGFGGGTMGILSYRIEGDTEEFIIVNSDSLTKVGIYEISPQGRFMGLYSKFNNINQTGCSYTDYSIVTRSGQLVITKFDLQNTIISGEFEFTLARLGCDTVKITHGRFDLRI